MPTITGPVGPAKTNAHHDVAIVQVMLRAVKNAAGQSYLQDIYDGSFGNKTREAIEKFQKDHKLSAPPAPKAPPSTDPYGTIAPNSATFKKLNDMLPASHRSILCIPNTRTVYLPGTDAAAATSQNSISTDDELEPAFRAKVAELVSRMFNRHKIVLWVTTSGRRRTFAEQLELQANGKSGAGPGESNHNFGQAVDIGFKDFEWFKPDGLTTKKDAYWLNALEVWPTKFKEMWEARNAIATELGLFKTNFAGDWVHLQAFSDNAVSMGRSLAGLITRVATLHWKYQGGVYQCDLGAGQAGPYFSVGTAKQIWNLQATVTKDNIAKARSVSTGKAVAAASIKENEIQEYRQLLKGEFERAEANWRKWQPLP